MSRRGGAMPAGGGGEKIFHARKKRAQPVFGSEGTVARNNGGFGFGLRVRLRLGQQNVSMRGETGGKVS